MPRDYFLHKVAVTSVAVKMPPFWHNYPQIWFALVESQFELFNITKELTKFHHVVSNSSQETATEVRYHQQQTANSPVYCFKKGSFREGARIRTATYASAAFARATRRQKTITIASCNGTITKGLWNSPYYKRFC